MHCFNKDEILELGRFSLGIKYNSINPYTYSYGAGADNFGSTGNQVAYFGNFYFSIELLNYGNYIQIGLPSGIALKLNDTINTGYSGIKILPLSYENCLFTNSAYDNSTTAQTIKGYFVGYQLSL